MRIHLYKRTSSTLITSTRGSLIWRPSKKEKTSSGRVRVAPAALLLQSPAGERTLHEGGRLSQDLVRRYAPEIDEFFGAPVAYAAHARKTVGVE